MEYIKIARSFKKCFAQLFPSEYPGGEPVLTPVTPVAPVAPDVSPENDDSERAALWIDWYNRATAAEQEEFDKIAKDIDLGYREFKRAPFMNNAMYNAIINYRSSGGRKVMR
jgi:hypothetical protein